MTASFPLRATSKVLAMSDNRRDRERASDMKLLLTVHKIVSIGNDFTGPLKSGRQSLEVRMMVSKQ